MEESTEAFTAPLIEDIERLSKILGAVIKSENKEVYEVKFEALLHFAS